ncbi:MAG: AAA family ATPase [Xanthobacteraceae bacterium]
MDYKRPRSEIRESTISALFDKVRRKRHNKYLSSVTLDKLRRFSGATISFDFPVVALIGANGSGKTTILNACACVCSTSIHKKVFQASQIGDGSMEGWRIAYELLDRSLDPDPIQGELEYRDGAWQNSTSAKRSTSLLGLMRTLPLSENPYFQIRKILTKKNEKKAGKNWVRSEELSGAIVDRTKSEGERILGKSLAGYKCFEVTVNSHKPVPLHVLEPKARSDGKVDWRLGQAIAAQAPTHTTKQTIFVGQNELDTYSEFNFGAGESSVLRIIHEIESVDVCSLVLIEEIENGLSPNRGEAAG